MSRVLSVVEEYCLSPPRSIEMEWNGRWWPGQYLAMRRYNDHQGWKSHVRYVVSEACDEAEHVESVPWNRIREPTFKRR